MRVDPNENAVILTGILYEDDDADILIEDLNLWAKEEGFFSSPKTRFTKIEKIEGKPDAICWIEGGSVNPSRSLDYYEMGWTWIKDYINK